MTTVEREGKKDAGPGSWTPAWSIWGEDIVSSLVCATLRSIPSTMCAARSWYAEWERALLSVFFPRLFLPPPPYFLEPRERPQAGCREARQEHPISDLGSDHQPVSHGEQEGGILPLPHVKKSGDKVGEMCVWGATRDTSIAAT